MRKWRSQGREKLDDLTCRWAAGVRHSAGGDYPQHNPDHGRRLWLCANLTFLMRLISDGLHPSGLRYAAVAFLGQHSRAGVRAGIMAHSCSSLGIQNILLKGKPVGEIESA
jgi:hypothetical protein